MIQPCLTAQSIAEQAEEKARTDSNLAIRRQINKIFRLQDDSSLYPIHGRFNATERAIRKVCKLERQTDVMGPLEYALALEQEISDIVNQEN
jgi:hypothetical protein